MIEFLSNSRWEVTVARTAIAIHEVSANVLLPQQNPCSSAPFLNGAVWTSMWLSGVGVLLISPFLLFLLFKNILFQSSSSLFLSCMESKRIFNEALILYFFKCFSPGLDDWHLLSFSVCLLPKIRRNFGIIFSPFLKAQCGPTSPWPSFPYLSSFPKPLSTPCYTFLEALHNL